MTPEAGARAVVRVPPRQLQALRSSAAQVDGELWTRLIYPYVTPMVAAVEYRRLEILLRAIPAPANGHVLDAGTGFGVLLPSLAGCFREVDAIDVDTALVAAAQRLVAACHLANVRVQAQDLTSLAYSAQTFDAVISASVLEHLPDASLDRALSEVARVLKPGGALCCCSPSENMLYRALRVVARKRKPPDHYQTAHSIRTAVARRFRIVGGRNIPRLPDPLSLFEVVVAVAP
jgi:2-polyprenyl-3-methyl-5-hydroxy-6-metoxy-1,4-benzoquinol methylase